jgi:hypothetical protein
VIAVGVPSATSAQFLRPLRTEVGFLVRQLQHRHLVPQRRVIAVAVDEDDRRLQVAPDDAASSGENAGGVLHSFRYFAEMVQGIPEAHLQLRELLEVMAADVFVGNADPAV